VLIHLGLRKMLISTRALIDIDARCEIMSVVEELSTNMEVEP